MSTFTAVNGSGSPAPAVPRPDDSQKESTNATNPRRSNPNNNHPVSQSPTLSRQEKPSSRQEALQQERKGSPAQSSTPPVAPAAPITATRPGDQHYSKPVPSAQPQAPSNESRAHSMANGVGPSNTRHPETAVMSPQKRKRSFSQEHENVHAGVFQNGGPPASPGVQRLSEGMDNSQLRDREPYSPRHAYPPPQDIYHPSPHDAYPGPAHHAYPPPTQERQHPEIYPRPDRHSLVSNEYDQPVDPSIVPTEARPYYGPDAHMAEVLQRENRSYDSMPSHNQYGTPEDDDDPQYGNYDGGRGSQSGMDVDRKRRKRIFSNRTKTGCMTCRRRKKKCDEQHPECK